jgi:G3E family GTPase
MAVATFDTLKFANTLKAAGMPPQQAEAQAQAFAEVIQLNLKDLVTKDDLDRAVEQLRNEVSQTAKSTKVDPDQAVRDLRHEIKEESLKLSNQITRLDGRMDRVMWALGLVITLCTGILIRLFFVKP